MRLDVGLRTSIGPVRTHNEDWAVENGRMGAFAVADGQGGLHDGALVSAVFCTAVVDCLAMGKPPDVASMHRAFEVADALWAKVARALDCDGTSCSGVALWIGDGRAVIGHVGDCRAWRVREGRAERLTADHSLVARRVLEGRLTEAEAHDHPHRNILLRVFGAVPASPPEVSVQPTVAGDVYALLTDGALSITADELVELAETPARSAADQIVDRACTRDGRDNVAAVVVRVLTGP